MAPAVERRSTERFPCGLETKCQLPKGVWDDPWPARVKDISKGGIGLVLKRRFEPGTLLVFELQSGVQGFTKTLLARVRHATDQKDGSGWCHGCSFASELSDDELQALRVERVRHTSPDCRDWVRFPSKLHAACSAGEKDHWPAKVVNLSPGGVGLMATKQFAVGNVLMVELPHADGKGVMRLMVRVVHASARQSGQWMLGCAFAKELTEQELDTIVES